MARISVQDLHIHLPIYNFHSRSLKKNALRISSGGRIQAQSKAIVVEALRSVSFELRDGDRVGIIGANGAGKTTLLRALAGVYQPTSGSIEIEGNLVPMLSIEIGIYEEASGGENIRNVAVQMGMTKSELDEKYDEIADFTELGEYLELPIYTYSLGMRARLSFAVATALDAEILLLDEVISAGDARFAAKATARFRNFVDRTKILILASHSTQWIRDACNKAILLADGELIEFGEIETVLRSYERRNAAL